MAIHWRAVKISLRGTLGISKLRFLIKKIFLKNFICIFFSTTLNPGLYGEKPLPGQRNFYKGYTHPLTVGNLSVCPFSWGSQRYVVYLGWQIAPSYMSPKCGGRGGGGLQGLSQWAQLYTGAQMNFGDLTPYLTYAPFLNLLDWHYDSLLQSGPADKKTTERVERRRRGLCASPLQQTDWPSAGPGCVRQVCTYDI